MHTALSTSALPKFSAVEARSHRLAKASNLTRSASKRFSSGPATTALPLEITPGILGNHLAVQGFLQRTLHRPSPADFAASTGRPGYSPSERYLVRGLPDRGLVGHVQLEPQIMRFGRVDVPITRLRDLTVLPEYQRQGLDHRMLSHAEQTARDSGTMLIVARGENQALLQKQGWSTLGTDPVSTVSPQRLMGQLPPPPQPESPFFRDQHPRPDLQIARLTHIASLQSLYEQFIANAYGATVRCEAYWSWLIKKGAHHRIYLYSEDGQPLAYAVVRGASVLELVDATSDRRGSARLLERVGADAIEQGRHTIRIHAPFSDKSHEWSDLGGGRIFVAGTEETWMVKILSWRNLMRRMATELRRRLKPSVDPVELGIRIGSEEFLIKQGVRSMRITRSSSVHQVEMTLRGATQLLMGFRSVEELARDRLLVATTAEALEAAKMLFPPMNLWRTKWDDVGVVTA